MAATTLAGSGDARRSRQQAITAAQDGALEGLHGNVDLESGAGGSYRRLRERSRVVAGGEDRELQATGAVTALRLITKAAVIQGGNANDQDGIKSETEGDAELSFLIFVYTFAVVGITLLVMWAYGRMRVGSLNGAREGSPQQGA